MARLRDKSPTWHRRARRKRSLARSLLQRWKRKRHFNSVQTSRLIDAQFRLATHHSRVAIRLSTRQRSAMSRKSASQWYGSTRWSQWSPQNPQQPKSGKTRAKAKGETGDKNKKEDVMLEYDAIPWQPGSVESSSSSGSEAKARESYINGNWVQFNGFWFQGLWHQSLLRPQRVVKQKKVEFSHQAKPSQQSWKSANGKQSWKPVHMSKASKAGHRPSKASRIGPSHGFKLQSKQPPQILSQQTHLFNANFELNKSRNSI